MHVVLSWPRGRRPEVYGPFRSTLHAADFAKEHQQLTGVASEIKELIEPPVYGDEGL